MSTPRIGFMIGGVQKSGTTALAQYLRSHPAVRLPGRKEAHVFDAPTFESSWSSQEIDARFETLFDGGFSDDPALRHGDATPISVFHPIFVQRIARYNPEMRWVLLLRDPVERAISQYYMERERGDEKLSLPVALLAERKRLHGHEDDFSEHSPLRHHSYLARGRYLMQLDWLLKSFRGEQVLLVSTNALQRSPSMIVERTLRFLGLPPLPADVEYPRVFAGGWQGRTTPRLLAPLLAPLFRRERGLVAHLDTVGTALGTIHPLRF